MKRSNVMFIIIVYLFSIFFLFLTIQLPSIKEVSTTTGPATWPFTLLIFILIVNTIATILLILNKGNKKEKIENNNNKLKSVKEEIEKDIEEVSEEVSEEPITNRKKQYLFIIIFAGYLLLLYLLGFILSTLIFFMIFSYLLGMRNKVVLILSSTVATFAIYALFNNILNVPLP